MEKKMQSIISVARASLALAICSLAWPLARGASPIEAPQTAGSVTEVPAAQVTPTAISGLGVPLGTSQLDGYRGGFDLVKSDMQLNGTVATNSATNVTTGSNYIGQGAFANASGLPMVIQNSGSNVLIQNATIVNVELK